MDTHPQESDYGSSPWVDLGTFEPPSHHSPPLPDFHSFGYGSSPIMPMEPAYSMSIPPPYSALHLTMPSPPWPSMLTTQSAFPESTLSPTPAPTLSIPQPPPLRPIHTAPTAVGPTPRRTLTDEDRRRMCLYHEENKTAKQTDIGALFGVERSTVSKVLRQKEKYLNMDDGSRSPIKRSKGKVPDIEKALANWARNHLREGKSPLTDAMIRERAQMFAATCGSPDGKPNVFTSSWLEKFKRENNLGGSKSRKSSVDKTASDAESPIRVNTSSSSQTSTQVSPVLPTDLIESPLSPSSQETVKRELSDGLLDLTRDYQHAHSQSTTSLETAPSLSASVTSPTSPLISESPYTPSVRSRLPSISSSSSRRRSQTFPLTGDMDSLAVDAGPDQPTPKSIFPQGHSVSVFDSPLEEEPENDLPSVESSYVKRNRSNPEIKTTSMHPPPLPKSSNVSPISTPGSPTQDEARRALELVMNYFQSQPTGLQAQDYITMGKLMEKLELAQSQANSLSGRLHRIDEHTNGPRMSKKRSIHSLT